MHWACGRRSTRPPAMQRLRELDERSTNSSQGSQRRSPHPPQQTNSLSRKTTPHAVIRMCVSNKKCAQTYMRTNMLAKCPHYKVPNCSSGFMLPKQDVAHACHACMPLATVVLRRGPRTRRAEALLVDAALKAERHGLCLLAHPPPRCSWRRRCRNWRNNLPSSFVGRRTLASVDQLEMELPCKLERLHVRPRWPRGDRRVRCRMPALIWYAGRAGVDAQSSCSSRHTFTKIQQQH